ncbi:MAG: hypothetical protein ACHQQ3_03205 [Gemmatimonadales bacterium]
MHKLQRNQAASLRRARGFLDDHAKVLAAVNRTEARRQLDAAVHSVDDAGRLQNAYARAMRGETNKQRSLERELRETHLVPIGKLARAHLKRLPGMAALAPKLKNLGGPWLVQMARAIVIAGAEFREVFTAASYPARFLEDLAAAADALDASLARRSQHRSDRVTATAGIAVAIASGRNAVAMLDPVVGRIIAGNAGLVKGWRDAKRITAVARPVRKGKAAKRISAAVRPTRKGKAAKRARTGR